MICCGTSSGLQFFFRQFYFTFYYHTTVLELKCWRSVQVNPPLSGEPSASAQQPLEQCALTLYTLLADTPMNSDRRGRSGSAKRISFIARSRFCGICCDFAQLHSSRHTYRLRFTTSQSGAHLRVVGKCNLLAKLVVIVLHTRKVSYVHK